MSKCPPTPALQFVREPCHFCGAGFDEDGFSINATAESLAAQDDWYGTHYDCFEGCKVSVGGSSK